MQTRYPAAIMRLLCYPARTVEQAEELEPGIGVSVSSSHVDAAVLTTTESYWSVGSHHPDSVLAHQADFECFTILRQTDVTGLQVQNRKGDCECETDIGLR